MTEPAPIDAEALVRPKAPGIVGIVTGLHQRAEPRGSRLNRQVDQVVTFEMERRDDGGRVLAKVPIEMRGLGFNGVLREGDQVQIPGSLRIGQAGHTVRIERLENLTAGDRFATMGPPLSSVIIGIGAFIGVAAVMIAFFVQFLTGSGL